jgi:hypothetical protein
VKLDALSQLLGPIVKLAHERNTSRTFSRSSSALGIWNERPSFTFHGYLPIEKRSSPKNLEKISLEKISLKFLLKLPTETIKCWKISYRLYILKPICVLLLILLYQPNISKRREHLPEKENIDLHNRPSILSSIKCSFCRCLINYFTFDYQNEKKNKKKNVLIFVLGILAFFCLKSSIIGMDHKKQFYRGWNNGFSKLTQ